MGRVAILVLMCAAAGAQSLLPTTPALQPLRQPAWRLLADDQMAIAAAPAHAVRQWKWAIPAAGVFAILFATDARNMRERVHTGDAVRERSTAVSNTAAAGIAIVPLYLTWRGWHDADDDARAAGLRSIRAATDALIAAEILRLAIGRERPPADDGRGRFEHGSRFDAGFPSLHAAAAWSIASVIAQRYPGWLGTAVYGAAATVSAARVVGREHFPSDVVAGSLLGFLVGRYVGRQPDNRRPEPPRERSTAPAGSAYVPLESWIYPALDRLAALGLIPSQTSGLRPWTRAECRRQMLEAEERAGAASETRALLRSLHAELDRAPASVTLDSLYVRAGAISGQPLNDSFHFGETWSNDQGRPFGRGANAYTGFTARAESGRFFAAAQAEYQHAPRSAAYALPVRQTVAALDGVPVSDSGFAAPVDRFRTVEAYAGMRLGDLQVSVGKQAMWWGPTYDSPLSFGSNAEPTKSLKVSTVAPVRIGPVGIRGEFVLGKLGGQQYTWRPWFNAQKLSFKVTENLELGFTRWSIFWGVGHPITAGTLLRNFTSATSTDAGNGRNDPGDRKGGFDFRYRIPGLRNWLTLYSDSYCDDDPSPLAAPRRAAINPGLYLARVPGLRQLDLRIEAPSTQPMGWDMGGQFLYYNNQYRSGNTNYGNLLGNPIGRDGRAVQSWLRWWLTGRDRVEAGYRQAKLSGRFLAGGGTQSDATLRATVEVARGWSAAVMTQYERFWVPMLGGPRRNLSAWVQLSWEPSLQVLR
jgi:membrane-associated phospholipid phosphatase